MCVTWNLKQTEKVILLKKKKNENKTWMCD